MRLHSPAGHGEEERWGERWIDLALRAPRPGTPAPSRGPADLRCPVKELAHGLSAVEGWKKLVPPMRTLHQFRLSFFLFDPRRQPFRVLRSPAFAAGTATPYGHDRAAEQAAHVTGTGRVLLVCFGFGVTNDGAGSSRQPDRHADYRQAGRLRRPSTAVMLRGLVPRR
jgi:hypothetical protein